jgi:16S rRNA (uracil1498-N3)-methyltransferase
MEIAPPRSVAEIARDPGDGAMLVVADRDGGPLEPAAAEGRPLIAVVGPEGGLTAEELATLEAAGGRRVSLGPHVLRVETAAIALAARLA